MLMCLPSVLTLAMVKQELVGVKSEQASSLSQGLEDGEGLTARGGLTAQLTGSAFGPPIAEAQWDV